MLGGSGIARGIMRTTRAQHLHSRLYLFGLPMIGFPSLRGMISDKFGCGTREETSSGRLVRKVTTAVQLAVSVLRHPDVVIRKLCTSSCDAIRVCEHELSWRWDELVSDWSFADRIDFVRVDNFEYSVLLKMAGSGYRRFARSRLYEYILVVMRFYYCI